MQDVASVLTDQFAALLERLPADLDLDCLALETKAIQRKRELVDGAVLLRIALAWENVNSAAREVSEFNLDRKPYVFNVFGWLAEAARG